MLKKFPRVWTSEIFLLLVEGVCLCGGTNHSVGWFLSVEPSIIQINNLIAGWEALCPLPAVWHVSQTEDHFKAQRPAGRSYRIYIQGKISLLFWEILSRIYIQGKISLLFCEILSRIYFQGKISLLSWEIPVKVHSRDEISGLTCWPVYLGWTWSVDPQEAKHRRELLGLWITAWRYLIERRRMMMDLVRRHSRSFSQVGRHTLMIFNW